MRILQVETLYVLYTDESILSGTDSKYIDQIIKDLKKEKLDITIKGGFQDVLGVNTEMKLYGSIHLTQPHLIDHIIKYLHLEGEQITTKPTPASSLVLLLRNSELEAHDDSFNYRSIIGELNYLKGDTRSDISYITRQCAASQVIQKWNMPRPSYG